MLCKEQLMCVGWLNVSINYAGGIAVPRQRGLA